MKTAQEKQIAGWAPEDMIAKMYKHKAPIKAGGPGEGSGGT